MSGDLKSPLLNQPPTKNAVPNPKHNRQKSRPRLTTTFFVSQLTGENAPFIVSQKVLERMRSATILRLTSSFFLTRLYPWALFCSIIVSLLALAYFSIPFDHSPRGPNHQYWNTELVYYLFVLPNFICGTLLGAFAVATVTRCDIKDLVIVLVPYSAIVWGTITYLHVRGFYLWYHNLDANLNSANYSLSLIICTLSVCNRSRSDLSFIKLFIHFLFPLMVIVVVASFAAGPLTIRFRAAPPFTKVLIRGVIFPLITDVLFVFAEWFSYRISTNPSTFYVPVRNPKNKELVSPDPNTVQLESWSRQKSDEPSVGILSQKSSSSVNTTSGSTYVHSLTIQEDEEDGDELFATNSMLDPNNKYIDSGEEVRIRADTEMDQCVDIELRFHGLFFLQNTFIVISRALVASVEDLQLVFWLCFVQMIRDIFFHRWSRTLQVSILRLIRFLQSSLCCGNWIFEWLGNKAQGGLYNYHILMFRSTIFTAEYVGETAVIIFSTAILVIFTYKAEYITVNPNYHWKYALQALGIQLSLAGLTHIMTGYLDVRYGRLNLFKPWTKRTWRQYASELFTFFYNGVIVSFVVYRVMPNQLQCSPPGSLNVCHCSFAKANPGRFGCPKV